MRLLKLKCNSVPDFFPIKGYKTYKYVILVFSLREAQALHISF